MPGGDSVRPAMSCGRLNLPQRYQVLIAGTCALYLTNGKSDFANVTKLKILRWEIILGHLGELECSNKYLYKRQRDISPKKKGGDCSDVTTTKECQQ